MTVGHFLTGIAALIWQPDTKKYLLLRRARSKDVGAGAWECVTGRVDQGESFEDAFFREVQEELGSPMQFEFFIGTTHFFRGEAVPENELLGLICCCTLVDPDAIRLSVEHDALKWMTAAEIRSFLPENHWLQSVIRRAEFLHEQLPPAVKDGLREGGLDIGPIR